MDYSFNNDIVEWADMVIEIWLAKMHQLGIHNASEHALEFEWHAYNAAGGDIARVVFVFEYFLKFTDMGVGKGVSLSTRSQVNTRRRQKQWYSATFLLEVKKLRNILATKYARKGTMMIIENLSDNALAWDKSGTRI
jgi:hypothetical protein